MLINFAAFVVVVAGIMSAKSIIIPFLLAANMLNNLLSVLTNTFMIMLTFVFILLEAAGFPDKLRAMAGGSGASLHEYGKIIRGVNRYLGLKVITSLATGIIVSIGLQVIGVDFALMWGVVAFLLNFIPTIGSIIAAVPPMLLALVQPGPSGSLATAGLYLAANDKTRYIALLLGSNTEAATELAQSDTNNHDRPESA